MLDAEFNSKILRLAPRFTAKDDAPSSFETLKASATGGLVVWSGASDKTIYGDAFVNWSFRAWHDSIHLKLNADFSLEGEKRVAIEQCRIIQSDALARVIMGESIGQVEYFLKYGFFPVDQMTFMRNYLKGIL